MKYFLAAVIFFSPAALSQNIKHKNVFLTSSQVTANLSYKQNTSDKSFLFNFYESKNDSTNARPLVIWMHGGGFKYGSKDAEEINIWANEFAKHGYAFAAINYRLSKEHPISKFRDLVAACYTNVDDATDAIHFFKMNAGKFNIDTNKIILGGNSAGAIIALQTVYSNCADLQNVIDSNKSVANTGNYNPEHIAAVINFWGALFNDSWLSRVKVPVVSVCGRKDKIVPITTKGVAFFGSLDIHNKADSLRIPNDLKIYEGYGHELQKHFNPFFKSNGTKIRWNSSATFVIDFLNQYFEINTK